MSYCVNCGVELDNSAKKCALCSTPVINPNINSEVTAEKPFSEIIQIPKSIKKEFIAFIITVIMLIPNIVMLFLNIFFFREGFWSVYAASSSLLLWVLFVLPLFAKKSHPFLMWGFDTAAVTGFFYTVFSLHGAQLNVIRSTLCIIALVSVSVLFYIIWSRKRKHHWTAVIFIFLFEITVLSFLSGAVTSYFMSDHKFLVVGIVIAICSFVMMLFFFYCNRSKYVRAWLSKAFYL